MLVDLSIHSFVLIDQLDLSPDDGFTALTGETGAGKSIILDALSVALGGPAERRMVRTGDDRAMVSAAFSPTADHAVWTILEAADLHADPDELLTLKRVIPRKGAIRAYVNDQPVSATRLREVGRALVEIHGQHAAMALMRPASHCDLLDRYAGNGDLLAACASAWGDYAIARDARAALEHDKRERTGQLESLETDLAALDEITPLEGEAEALSAERAALSHGQRLRDGLAEASAAITESGNREAVALAARAVDRLCRLPGLDGTETSLAFRLRALSDSLERVLIETDEAESLLGDLLQDAVGDDGRLDTVEARLFAIRGLARRFGVEPDALPALRAKLAAECASLREGDEALSAATAREVDCRARWRTAAERLSEARRSAASRLGGAVQQELKPLKMGGVTLRFRVDPAPDGACGASGQDRVEIEVETTKGAGFGPLAKIASGGELARVSLALRCALSDRGGAAVLVFDEADQGVGGAVAAAIGERLARLGADRQVFAVTHSPQVAAAGDDQWRIEKKVARSGAGLTRVSRLDEAARLEEVARMLSGRTVTDEARKAAARLLEAPCRTSNP